MRIAALLSAALLLPATGSQAPPTPKNPATDAYFGTAVRDDYRWLEDWSLPAVQAWSRAQNEHARAVLDALPHYAQIQERIASIANFRTTSWASLVRRGDTIFALETAPPKQQPFLVALRSPDAPAAARVLVDPNVLDPKGTTAIDFFVPSLDGRFVAVSLSEGGSEAGDVSVYEVASARRLPDVIPRVNGGTAGGGVAWNADASGFFYTRYPRPPERAGRDLDFFQQVYFHRLGTPTDADVYALGQEFPKIAETALAGSDDGRFVLATVKNGDGGEAHQYLRRPDGSWTRIATLADERRARALRSRWLAVPDLAPRCAPRAASCGSRRARPCWRRPARSCRRATPPSKTSGSRTGASTSPVWSAGPRRSASTTTAARLSGRCPCCRSPPSRDSSRSRATRSSSRTRAISCRRPGTASTRTEEFAKTALASRVRCRLLRLRGHRETAASKDGTSVPIRIVQPEGAPPRRRQSHAPLRVRRLRDQPAADLRPDAAGLARAGRRLGGRESPRRRRVGRGVAPHRTPPPEAERLRRLRRLRAAAHRREVHEARPSRDRGRLERRSPHGRSLHSASRAVRRGRLPRRHLRHAALRTVVERRAST